MEAGTPLPGARRGALHKDREAAIADNNQVRGAAGVGRIATEGYTERTMNDYKVRIYKGLEMFDTPSLTAAGLTVRDLPDNTIHCAVADQYDRYVYQLADEFNLEIAPTIYDRTGEIAIHSTPVYQAAKSIGLELHQGTLVTSEGVRLTNHWWFEPTAEQLQEVNEQWLKGGEDNA